MHSFAKAATAIIADLVIGGFGYLLLTGTDLDVWSKEIGVVVCLIAIMTVTSNALDDSKDSERKDDSSS